MTFFSINAKAPVVNQGIDSFQERIEPTAEGYTLSSERGYDTATFILHGEEDYLNEWFKNGLARDVVWKAPDGFETWNGYVSRMTLGIGGIARTRKPGTWIY